MKTSELTGAALDWAAAKCEGTLGVKPRRCCDCKYHEERGVQDGSEYFCHHPKAAADHWYDSEGFGEGIASDYGVHQLCPISDLTPEPYSTDWSQGGPIIEREKITVAHHETKGWSAWDGYSTGLGATPLEAAMRVYVWNKLGDNVEIPEGL